MAEGVAAAEPEPGAGDNVSNDPTADGDDEIGPVRGVLAAGSWFACVLALQFPATENNNAALIEDLSTQVGGRALGEATLYYLLNSAISLGPGLCLTYLIFTFFIYF